LAAYRRAAGHSQAGFAGAVNWSRSTIANVETGRQHVPRRFWEAADEVLGARGNLIEANDRVEAAARQERGEAARGLHAALYPAAAAEHVGDRTGQATCHAGGGSSAGADVRELMTWIASSNTSDDAIEQISSASRYLAEAHNRLPAVKVLTGVLQAQQRAQQCLRSGCQRLRQTRELLRIDACLLAHACLLLGDLGHNRLAAEYGAAALAFAQEAGADEAMAWSVQAKTARWRDRYVESAAYRGHFGRQQWMAQDSKLDPALLVCPRLPRDDSPRE
jgi:hypothetical protein